MFRTPIPAHRQITAALAGVAALLAAGCGSSAVAIGPSSGIASGWAAAVPVDLATGSASNPSYGPAASGFTQTFQEFELRQVGSQAVLGALLFDGHRYGAYSTRFVPGSAGGSGWTGAYASLDDGSTPLLDLSFGSLPGAGFATAVFFGDTAASAQSALFSGKTATWGDPRSDFLAAAPLPTPEPSNGLVHAVAYDPSGVAYLAANVAGTGFQVIPYGSNIGWDTPFTIESSPMDAVQLVNDGLGVTAVYRMNAGGAMTLKASSLVDVLGGTFTSFGSTQTLATSPNALPFAAAADGSGDVVALSIAQDTTLPACSASTNPPTSGCQYRVFGSIRTVAQGWIGPSRLDSPLDSTVTSVYQSPAGGGMLFPDPAVAYLGSGVFLGVFPMTDNAALTSTLYAIAYRVGQGWDPAPVAIDATAIPAGGNQLRLANVLSLASDGQGNALLVVQSVVPAADLSTMSDRVRNYLFYRYTAASGWAAPYAIESEYNCIPPAGNVLNDRCWNPRPQAVVFPTGEMAAVVPVPDVTFQGYLRLFSVFFTP